MADGGRKVNREKKTEGITNMITGKRNQPETISLICATSTNQLYGNSSICSLQVHVFVLSNVIHTIRQKEREKYDMFVTLKVKKNAGERG